MMEIFLLLLYYFRYLFFLRTTLFSYENYCTKHNQQNTDSDDDYDSRVPCFTLSIICIRSRNCCIIFIVSIVLSGVPKHCRAGSIQLRRKIWKTEKRPYQHLCWHGRKSFKVCFTPPFLSLYQNIRSGGDFVVFLTG